MTARPRRRNTPQRRTILEHLRETTSHPTAAEIHAAVRNRLPRISLGTVYRNLDVLQADGLINRIDTAGNDARYDARLDPHDHVRCLTCGKLRDVPGPSRGAAAGPAAGTEVAGIAVRGCRLEYYGECAACRTNGWSPAAPAHR